MLNEYSVSTTGEQFSLHGRKGTSSTIHFAHHCFSCSATVTSSTLSWCKIETRFTPGTKYACSVWSGFTLNHCHWIRKMEQSLHHTKRTVHCWTRAKKTHTHSAMRSVWTSLGRRTQSEINGRNPIPVTLNVNKTWSLQRFFSLFQPTFQFTI